MTRIQLSGSLQNRTSACLSIHFASLEQLGPSLRVSSTLVAAGVILACTHTPLMAAQLNQYAVAVTPLVARLTHSSRSRFAARLNLASALTSTSGLLRAQEPSTIAQPLLCPRRMPDDTSAVTRQAGRCDRNQAGRGVVQDVSHQ